MTLELFPGLVYYSENLSTFDIQLCHRNMKHSLIRVKSTSKFKVAEILTLKEAAVHILSTENLLVQTELTFFYENAWKTGQVHVITTCNSSTIEVEVPPKPSRVFPPSNTPKSAKNAVVTALHGIAHAESYAMELFWDCIARYTDSNLPVEFYNDMVNIAGQEAKHFLDWYYRLEDLGCPYGSLWTHDGLWRSAEQTFHSLPERIAVINLLHEARGLDTFPITLQKLKSNGDEQSVGILRRNYAEEVYHVQTGVKWFRYIHHKDVCSETSQTHSNGELPAVPCSRCYLSCIAAFQDIVRKYHNGALKGPFNIEARRQAGLLDDWYVPLTEER